MAKIQEQMLSEGYTMYLDGWSTYFYNTNLYQAAKEMDEAGDMKFVLGMSYEIESWMDTDEALAKAIDAKQYASEHVKPNWVKLFIDGTVETGTGYVDPLYPDGHQGGGNWRRAPGRWKLDGGAADRHNAQGERKRPDDAHPRNGQQGGQPHRQRIR